LKAASARAQVYFNALSWVLPDKAESMAALEGHWTHTRDYTNLVLNTRPRTIKDVVHGLNAGSSADVPARMLFDAMNMLLLSLSDEASRDRFAHIVKIGSIMNNHAGTRGPAVVALIVYVKSRVSSNEFTTIESLLSLECLRVVRDWIKPESHGIIQDILTGRRQCLSVSTPLATVILASLDRASEDVIPDLTELLRQACVVGSQRAGSDDMDFIRQEDDLILISKDSSTIYADNWKLVMEWDRGSEKPHY